MGVRLICGFVLLLFVLTTRAADYCCSFENSHVCVWTNLDDVMWIWSGGKPPNLDGIDDFSIPGLNNSEYMYLETDEMTPYSAEIKSPVIVIDDGDKISIDFYRHAVGTNSLHTSIELFYIRSVGLQKTSLINLNTLAGWDKKTVICGGDFGVSCCITYPCEGSIHIKGDIENAIQGTQSLLAFTNITVNKCPDNTSHIVTTAAPPPDFVPQEFCNEFESDVADWERNGWFYSYNTLPDVQLQHDSAFVYSQYSDEATLTSPNVQLVSPTVNYSFDYSVQVQPTDEANSLIFMFHDLDSGNIRVLEQLSDTDSGWKTVTGNCTQCCQQFPCNGQFQYEVGLVDGSSSDVFAVDNVQINNGCEKNTVSCCDFEQPGMCGLQVRTGGESNWTWSGEQHPMQDAIGNTGNYMWWEVVNTILSIPITSTLQTPSITLYPNSVITLSYFAYVADMGAAHFDIQWQHDGNSTVLFNSPKESSSNWVNFNYTCSSVHNDCCNDENGCSGQLDFVAFNKGFVNSLFAIDNLKISDDVAKSCQL